MTRPRILCVLVLALSLAACGGQNQTGGSVTSSASETPGDGSGSLPAGEFAAQVCGSLKEWGTTITDSSQAFAGANATTFAEAKDALETWAATIVTSTDDAIDRLEAIDPPDVENGEEAKATMIDAMSLFRDAFTAIQGRIEDIEGEDFSAFEGAVEGISQELESRSEDIQARFDELEQNEELSAAFENEPACQDFSSG